MIPPTVEPEEHQAPAARRAAASAVGVVVIGRNEGERLARCLATVCGRGSAVVYVDSASRDGSPAAARAAGAEVLELDPSRPLSAARARNEGFARLAAVAPAVEFVQFVDGDCEIAPGWIEAALAAIFPSARDRLTFPELLAEGLEPHAVEDIYLAGPSEPNRWIDITDTIELKIGAMRCHQSQVRDPEGTATFMRANSRRVGKGRGLAYAEAFRYISFNTPRIPVEAAE